MYFVMYNSVVLSKILKIVVPLEQNFEKTDFYSIKLVILIIIGVKNGTTIFNILDNTTELWMTKYLIGEIFSSSGATFYKNPSDQTVYISKLERYTWTNLSSSSFSQQCWDRLIKQRFKLETAIHHLTPMISSDL